MMRMSSQVEYGIRAMIDIAVNGSDGPVQARDIHRRQQIDEHFISQIMLMLRRGGLIESLRGRQGGHRLARPASQITLLEIVEALEGTDDARDKGGRLGRRARSLGRSAPACHRSPRPDDPGHADRTSERLGSDLICDLENAAGRRCAHAHERADMRTPRPTRKL